MKLSFLFVTIITIFSLQSCDLDVGIKDNRIEGSVLKSDGIECDRVVMTVDDKKSTSNVFTFGNVVKFAFNNITGVEQVNDLVYPKMSMRVTNLVSDSTFYFEDDLLLNIKGGTDLNPLQLTSTFKTGLPHLNNEKYNIEIKIWDEKGTGQMTFNLPFVVKPSDVLSIDRNGLSYSNIYFWDETSQKVVLENKIDVNNTYILINEGIEGFDIVDGMIYPALSVLLVDNNGVEIINNENLIDEIRENGIDPIALKDKKLPITMTFDRRKAANPCHLTARFWDLKNPSKQIIISSDLTIE